MAIEAGFMGAAQIAGGSILRFSDASVSAKQEVVTPDLIMGDYDRNSFYYGPITLDGSISGPIDEEFGQGAWTWATGRDECGVCVEDALTINYFCATSNTGGINGVTIPASMVNSLSINASAGDVANFSLDIIGAGEPTWNPPQLTRDLTIRKLVTWDAMNLVLTDQAGEVEIDADPTVSAFEITLANNVTAVYSIGSGSLYPAKLIPGLRQITGSITFYGVPTGNPTNLDAGINYLADNQGTVTFTIGSLTVAVNVKFHRINPSAQVGPITSTLGFTGVGPQFR